MSVGHTLTFCYLGCQTPNDEGSAPVLAATMEVIDQRYSIILTVDGYPLFIQSKYFSDHPIKMITFRIQLDDRVPSTAKNLQKKCE